jgi:hypothetical protein
LLDYRLAGFSSPALLSIASVVDWLHHTPSPLCWTGGARRLRLSVDCLLASAGASQRCATDAHVAGLLQRLKEVFFSKTIKKIKINCFLLEFQNIFLLISILFSPAGLQHCPPA